MPRLSAVNEGSCSVSVSSSSDEVGIVKDRDMAGMAVRPARSLNRAAAVSQMASRSSSVSSHERELETMDVR